MCKKFARNSRFKTVTWCLSTTATAQYNCHKKLWIKFGKQRWIKINSKSSSSSFKSPSTSILGNRTVITSMLHYDSMSCSAAITNNNPFINYHTSSTLFSAGDIFNAGLLRRITNDKYHIVQSNRQLQWY